MYIHGCCCLFLGCVCRRVSKLLSVQRNTGKSQAWLTSQQMQLLTVRSDLQKGLTAHFFSPFPSTIKQHGKWKTQPCLMKTKTKSAVEKKKKKQRKKNKVFPTFDVIGRFQTWHWKTHTNCKQQHFLTCKQTQNPPIKPNFSPASPYFAVFSPPFIHFGKI